MANVVVAFSKGEDARNIRNVLVKHGYDVAAVCTSGSQAISSADELGAGVVVCGSRFADMMYRDIYECLPSGFSLLLMASPGQWREDTPSSNLVCLGLPLKVHDLISTLDMMLQSQARRRRQKRAQTRERSAEEQELIRQAKELLLDRNHMTEAEAHRYLQKCSMDSGTNMAEAAQMIMSLIHAG